MKPLVLTFLILISNYQKEDMMFCFAFTKDLNGVTIISEIHEFPTIKNSDELNAFKIINSKSFYKIIMSLGYQLPYKKDLMGVSNIIIIRKEWNALGNLYDEIKQKSNEKIVIIGKEYFSIISIDKREKIIRE